VGTTTFSNGVYGQFGDPLQAVTEGAGVYGIASGSNSFGDKAVGVVGQSEPNSTGVVGKSGNVARPFLPAGVYGAAESGIGVVGLSPFVAVYAAAKESAGVIGSSQRYGIFGVSAGPMGPDPLTLRPDVEWQYRRLGYRY